MTEGVVDQREEERRGGFSLRTRRSQPEEGWLGRISVIYDPEKNLSREKKDRNTVEGKNREESSVGNRLVKSLALLLPGRDV